jgi:filamentous hemagglutinin
MGGAHQGPAPRVHPGKQGKHVRGHNNFVEGNSELTADPLLLARRAGTGEQVGKPALGTAGSKERIDFGFEIGIYLDALGTVRIPTTVGMIHYAKDGAIHIVPARPSGRP